MLVRPRADAWFCALHESNRSETCLCQVRFGARGGGPPEAGVSLLFGSGSDFSEVPVFRDCAGHAGFRVVPGCPPGPCLFSGVCR